MNPAELTLNISPANLSNKPVPAPITVSTKNGKAPVPRVDLEPIYTQLKAALQDQWTDYKAAVSQFILGNLNQAELSWVLQPLLSGAPSVITSTNSMLSPLSTLHLHNTLLAALYANTLRDPPPSEVAPWVVATDKPTTAAKSAGAAGTNDKAEERLKKEVMAIHARDRRRIKSLKESGKAVNDGVAEMQDYRNELAVKPPDKAPQSAGGLTRTNWDVEIRRRYAQPLAEETLEFPTQSDIQNRIEPICYEEGLTGGTAQGALQACTEIMEQATEVFLKEMLGQMLAHVRSNGEGCIKTNKFKHQLAKEEDEVDRGIIQRTTGGVLPVEMEVQAKRDPLNMEDMRLAVQLSDTYTKQNPFLEQRVMLNRYAEPHQPVRPSTTNGISFAKPTMNGTLTKSERDGIEDAMAVEDADWNWKGGSRADTDDLMGVLDDCLAAVA